MRNKAGPFNPDPAISRAIRKEFHLPPNARHLASALERTAQNGVATVGSRVEVRVDPDILAHVAKMLTRAGNKKERTEREMLRTLGMLEGFGFKVPNYRGLPYGELCSVYADTKSSVLKEAGYNPSEETAA